jgi:hypothetical protein
MLTRRAVLTGTAASSIAAIASARGLVAAESSAQQGFNLGFGSLDGAVGGFFKYNDSFNVFLKFKEVGAEVFIKEGTSGVEVFYKSFFKEWSPVTSLFLKIESLEGAEAAFHKISSQTAEFFIKWNNRGVLTTFESGAEGVQIDVVEVLPDVG